VKQAIKLAKEEEHKGRKVWCVFDFDIKLDQNGQKADYNNAIQLAHSKGFEVACSNDAFELWFILHYRYIDAQLTRNEYYPILNQLWQLDNYEESGKKIDFCASIYQKLENDSRASQTDAIERAKRLHDTQIDKEYADKNPYTDVYQLVEKLNSAKKI